MQRTLIPVRQRAARPRGFTIVEITVASAVLLIVIGLVYPMHHATIQAKQQEELSLMAQQHARLAIDRISEELRMASPATLNPTGLEPGIDLGTINQNFIQFQTVTWDGALNERTNSTWTQYQIGPGGTTVERVIYAEGDPLLPAVLTPVATFTVAQYIFIEPDLNANGVLEANEDVNRDGRRQNGLFFTVLQEDVNDDDMLGAAEDQNNNGRMDARLLVTVDTRVTSVGVAGGTGYASVTTIVDLRNSDVASGA